MLHELRRMFLHDTVVSYSPNPGKLRSVTLAGVCLYSKSKDSPGCSIGKHLTLKLANELDDWTLRNYNSTSLTSNVVWDRIPESLKLYGRKFLTAVQEFHDTDCNWNKSFGLTDAGINEMFRIEKRWCRER